MHRIERKRPPGWQIREGATLLRPLLLQEELIHHSKVAAALGNLTRNAGEDAKALVRFVKNAWASWPDGMRWSMGIAAQDGGSSMDWRTERQIAMDWRTERQIAMDWLYGDIRAQSVDLG